MGSHDMGRQRTKHRSTIPPPPGPPPGDGGDGDGDAVDPARPARPDLAAALHEAAEALRQAVSTVRTIARPEAVEAAGVVATQAEQMAAGERSCWGCPPEAVQAPAGFRAAVQWVAMAIRHAAIDLDGRPVLLLGTMMATERVLTLAESLPAARIEER